MSAGQIYPMAFFAFPAIRLGSRILGLSLPHAANGRFKAMIWCDPVPGFGRRQPVALKSVCTSARDPPVSVTTGGFRELNLPGHTSSDYEGLTKISINVAVATSLGPS